MNDWKTTLAGVLLFLTGVIPSIIQALTDFSAVVAKLSAILGGDITAIPSIFPLIMTFIGSLTLIWARDRATSSK